MYFGIVQNKNGTVFLDKINRRSLHYLQYIHFLIIFTTRFHFLMLLPCYWKINGMNFLTGPLLIKICLALSLDLHDCFHSVYLTHFYWNQSIFTDCMKYGEYHRNNTKWMDDEDKCIQCSCKVWIYTNICIQCSCKVQICTIIRYCKKIQHVSVWGWGMGYGWFYILFLCQEWININI